MKRLLTVLLAVRRVFSVGFAEVFEGQEEQHHLAVLVFYRHDIQKTPESISCKIRVCSETF